MYIWKEVDDNDWAMVMRNETMTMVMMMVAMVAQVGTIT
jgi:hypothetical protein